MIFRLRLPEGEPIPQQMSSWQAYAVSLLMKHLERIVQLDVGTYELTPTGGARNVVEVFPNGEGLYQSLPPSDTSKADAPALEQVPYRESAVNAGRALVVLAQGNHQTGNNDIVDIVYYSARTPMEDAG